ncbi:MAG: hypothetical protein MUO76_04690 [Anaerolineaceae bacterium]|nr:hypothetical protein [Anaerolineaceae bacterium]
MYTDLYAGETIRDQGENLQFTLASVPNLLTSCEYRVRYVCGDDFEEEIDQGEHELRIRKNITNFKKIFEDNSIHLIVHRCSIINSTSM